METEPRPTEESLEVEIGRLLEARGWKLATAESCTGGLIGHRITNVPGSSAYYLGGVVAYDNAVKERLLHVKRETLVRHGAVSEETAQEMARGIRQALGADIAVSVTGIAGPGGGSPEKPVGLTWIGLSTALGERAWRYLWKGSRRQIKIQAAGEALRLVLEELQAGQTGAGDESEERTPDDSRLFQPVEVSARFNSNGLVMPYSLTWEGQTYPVESTGRRWRAADGMHILAMLPGQVVELVYRPQETSWYLRAGRKPRRAV